MKFIDSYVWDSTTGNYVPRVIKNGDTTIAFGYGIYDEQLEEKLQRFVVHIDHSYSDTTKEYKGVAKLCPGDVYDEKRGIKIASKKAEYKARKAAYKRYAAMLREINSLSNALTKEMNKINKRLVALDSDFEEELSK